MSKELIKARDILSDDSVVDSSPGEPLKPIEPSPEPVPAPAAPAPVAPAPAPQPAAPAQKSP
jgi:hypothetical protein